MTNFDKMFTPEKKDPFWERFYDTDTMGGRVRAVLTPIVWIAVIVVSCIVGYSLGEGWGALFQVTSMLGPLVVAGLIQAGYWIVTGEGKWDW